MGWWLRFVGGVCIVLAALVVVLFVVVTIVVGTSAASEDAAPPALVPLMLLDIAASPFVAALYVAGLMAVGSICYVGGRALQHMDRAARQPRQRVRYVERPEPRHRAPPRDDARLGVGEAPVRRPYRRRR